MSTGFQLGRSQDDCDGRGAEAYELTTLVRGKIRGFNRTHRHSLLKEGEAAEGYHRSRRLKHPLRALFVVVGILLIITLVAWLPLALPNSPPPEEWAKRKRRGLYCEH